MQHEHVVAAVAHSYCVFGTELVKVSSSSSSSSSSGGGGGSSSSSSDAPI